MSLRSDDLAWLRLRLCYKYKWPLTREAFLTGWSIFFTNRAPFCSLKICTRGKNYFVFPARLDRLQCSFFSFVKKSEYEICSASDSICG